MADTNIINEIQVNGNSYYLGGKASNVRYDDENFDGNNYINHFLIDQINTRALRSKYGDYGMNIGENDYTPLNNSFCVGTGNCIGQNKQGSNGSAAVGYYLNVNRDDSSLSKFVVGKFNKDKLLTCFEVGCGENDNNRVNGFDVDNEGILTSRDMPILKYRELELSSENVSWDSSTNTLELLERIEFNPKDSYLFKIKLPTGDNLLYLDCLVSVFKLKIVDNIFNPGTPFPLNLKANHPKLLIKDVLQNYWIYQPKEENIFNLSLIGDSYPALPSIIDETVMDNSFLTPKFGNDDMNKVLTPRGWQNIPEDTGWVNINLTGNCVDKNNTYYAKGRRIGDIVHIYGGFSLKNTVIHDKFYFIADLPINLQPSVNANFYETITSASFGDATHLDLALFRVGYSLNNNDMVSGNKNTGLHIKTGPNMLNEYVTFNMTYFV